MASLLHLLLAKPSAAAVSGARALMGQKKELWIVGQSKSNHVYRALGDALTCAFHDLYQSSYCYIYLVCEEGEALVLYPRPPAFENPPQSTPLFNDACLFDFTVSVWGPNPGACSTSE